MQAFGVGRIQPGGKLGTVCTIHVCGGKEFYIHCPQVGICPVHSFDAVGENMHYRFVGSNLVMYAVFSTQFFNQANHFFKANKGEYQRAWVSGSVPMLTEFPRDQSTITCEVHENHLC